MIEGENWNLRYGFKLYVKEFSFCDSLGIFDPLSREIETASNDCRRLNVDKKSSLHHENHERRFPHNVLQVKRIFYSSRCFESSSVISWWFHSLCSEAWNLNHFHFLRFFIVFFLLIWLIFFCLRTVKEWFQGALAETKKPTAIPKQFYGFSHGPRFITSLALYFS